MENTVLIIDDDDYIYFFLNLVLRKKGICSIHARTIEEAKVKIRLTKSAYVFIDNHLPDGSGISFLPELRILAPDAVIVAMTALLPVKSRTDAYSLGADYFLEKPFSTGQINDLMERIMQN